MVKKEQSDKFSEAADRMDAMLELQYTIPELDWKNVKHLSAKEIEVWVIQLGAASPKKNGHRR